MKMKTVKMTLTANSWHPNPGPRRLYINSLLSSSPNTQASINPSHRSIDLGHISSNIIYSPSLSGHQTTSFQPPSPPSPKTMSSQPLLTPSPNSPTSPQRNIYFRLAAIYGATAVALGAFGAHGLKKRITDPARLANWGTASNYQVSLSYSSTLLLRLFR